MRERVEDAGIDTEGVATVAGQLTPLALASVDPRGNKSFSYYRFAGISDPLATLRAADVPDTALLRARIFDFGEASLRSPLMRVETLLLVQRARDLGLAVCYTPNYRASAWSGGPVEAADVQRQALALADLVLMNAEESELLSGCSDRNAAALRINALGPSVVVITSGREGAIVAIDSAPLFPRSRLTLSSTSARVIASTPGSWRFGAQVAIRLTRLALPPTPPP
jgi:2-dehydro-3-deoxygluconokinase